MTFVSRLRPRLICLLIGALFSPVATAQEGKPKADAKTSELERARQLIRGTPCPGNPDHNPVRVIRSVNCLHSLGKKQAISLLLEIASFEPGDSIVTNDDGEAVDARLRERSPHAQAVCMIVPLLFGIPEKGTPPPDAWYCTQTDKWRGVAGTQAIQGGIPFAISGEWTYGGRPYGTRPLVEWAAEHGELRAERLHPQDDPLQAVDALCDRIRSGVVVEVESCWDHPVGSKRDKMTEFLQEDLRGQAVRMLHDGMRDVKALEWDKMCETVVRRGIRWDPKREMHMLADRQNGR